ncbi:MAG: hypothetical protein AAF489_12290 [Bacteroidota bacterium]
MKSKYLIFIFRISTIVYLLLALYYFLSKQAGGGDEALFLSDLQLIASSGWSAAIQKGISIPYMILAYPISQWVEPYIALRLVNVLLFGGLILYFYKVRGFTSFNFYALLFFFYSTVGYFLAGTNDALFIICLVIFIAETQSVLSATGKSSLAWWGGALVISFFTRELIVVYAPVILLAVYFILKNKKGALRSLLIPSAMIVIFTVLNIPSLSANHALSYDKKLPPKTTTATWVQRQYHAQLLVNEGKLANFNHPNWKQTQQYLETNGDQSLPRTMSEALMFNPSMTIKEFFKDLVYIVLYGGRQLGLILPLVLVIFLSRFLKDRKLSHDIFIPTAVLVMACVFALIIISYVELRWLGPVFVAAIVYFYNLIEKRKVHRLLIDSNYVVITLLSWYGMYGMITKL